MKRRLPPIAAGVFPNISRTAVCPPDLNVFNKESIIRLSNSLTAKHTAFTKSYAALEHVRDQPFVIAVTSFDQPYSYMACQRAIEAVLHGYYVDEEKYFSSPRSQGVRLHGAELHSIMKTNGSVIELGLFSSQAYQQISAVIFSSCANMGKVRALSSDPNPNIYFTAFRLNPASDLPHLIRQKKHSYEENLLDGLRIYHNPFATHPLNPDMFRHPSVFQSYFQDDGWVYDQREGQLLTRFVFRLLVKGQNEGGYAL